MLTASDIVLLGGASLLGYVVLCLLVARLGRGRIVLWCLPVGVLLAASYALNLYGFRGGTLYAGLVSDHALNLAFTQNVIDGNYTGDYFDKLVPAQYSPLYFWVLGTGARVLGLSAFEVWRYAPIPLLLLLPFLIHAVGRQLGSARQGFFACFALLAIGSAHTNYGLGFFPFEHSPYDLQKYLLVKPHQVIAAILMVSWLLSFARGPREGATLGWTVRQVLLGSTVLLSYSLWFGVGLAALAVHAVLGVAWARRLPALVRLAVIAGLCLAVTSVYWLPYAWARMTGPAGSGLITNFFLGGQLEPSWVTFGMGFFGLLFLLGLLGFAQFRRSAGVRALLVATLLVYAWFFSTYITYPLFELSLLPHRCHVVLTVLLAFASAAGLERLREHLVVLGRERLVAPLTLALVAAVFLPSLLRWNPMTDRSLATAETPIPADVTAIVAALDRVDPPPTVVGPNRLPTLPVAALSRARMWISPDLVFANPLTRYHERVESVRAVVRGARAAGELAAGLEGLGIDAVLLRKGGRRGPFLDFWARPPEPLPDRSKVSPGLVLQLLRSMREGQGRESQRGVLGKIFFPPHLFDAEHFVTAFEDARLVLYLRR